MDTAAVPTLWRWVQMYTGNSERQSMWAVRLIQNRFLHQARHLWDVAQWPAPTERASARLVTCVLFTFLPPVTRLCSSPSVPSVQQGQIRATVGCSLVVCVLAAHSSLRLVPARVWHARRVNFHTRDQSIVWFARTARTVPQTGQTRRAVCESVIRENTACSSTSAYWGWHPVRSVDSTCTLMITVPLNAVAALKAAGRRVWVSSARGSAGGIVAQVL